MKNYLLTLLIGLLAGIEIAHWLERMAPPPSITHINQHAFPSHKNASVANPASTVNFDEPWVQALYAKQLTEIAASLSHLRLQQTNEAMVLLEANLDTNRKKVEEYILTMEKAPADADLLLAVRQANAYRMEFPRPLVPLKP